MSDITADTDTVENKFAANLEVALTAPAAPFPGKSLQHLRSYYERDSEDHYVRLIAATLDRFVHKYPIETADAACDIVIKTRFRSPGYTDLLASAVRAVNVAYDCQALPLDDTGYRLEELYKTVSGNLAGNRTCILSEEREQQLQAIRAVAVDSLLERAAKAVQAGDPRRANNWAETIWNDHEDGRIKTIAGNTRLDAAEALLKFKPAEAETIANDLMFGRRSDPLQQRAAEIMSRCAAHYSAAYGEHDETQDLLNAANCWNSIARSTLVGTKLHTRACHSLNAIAGTILLSQPGLAVNYLSTVLSETQMSSKRNPAASMLRTIEDTAKDKQNWSLAMRAAAVQAKELPQGDKRQISAYGSLLDHAAHVAEANPLQVLMQLTALKESAPESLKPRLESDGDTYAASYRAQREAAEPKRPSLSPAEADALIAKLRAPKVNAAKPA